MVIKIIAMETMDMNVNFGIMFSSEIYFIFYRLHEKQRSLKVPNLVAVRSPYFNSSIHDKLP
ncbi:hypothetical protein J8TS2_26470 [Lederbergia ruris]|uniref:Uncharacterized protein n=1 Tax=Lederbergia ruris TaxID=217495 RepID=A0ABQ4KK46_9BACI|nr:hypothetical protein J8TS2_26470 [Lederbergia ruris]